MDLRLAYFAAVVLCLMGINGIRARAQTPARDLPDAPVPMRDSFTSAQGGTAPRPGTSNVPAFTTRLNAKQKYALAYRRIFSLQTPLKAAFISGFETAAGTGPDFPTNGWVPFAKRFGYNGLNLTSSIFLDTAVVPALVHQDPRYPVLGSGPAKSRIGWALKREFVAFSDDGREMPNYGNLVGLGLASILTNAYLPREDVSYRDTVQSYCIRLGLGAGMNVAREFQLYDHVKTIVRHSKAATN
jgi:hypothetical protein